MTAPVPNLENALPFWISLIMLPLFAISCIFGGWTLLLVPAYGWVLVSILDRFAGLDEENMDPETGEEQLYWYRMITIIWLPLQLIVIFGGLMVVSWSGHLSGWEKLWLMLSVGIITGSIGINYAHELIHRPNRFEHMLGEWMLISVLYGHFKSEHTIIHHRYVGTPRDPVTARYNETFYHFFPRVLWGCLVSAWKAEKERLDMKQIPIWDRRNPFVTYIGGSLLFILLAALIGGWMGIFWFVFQSFIAIWQLEMVNYVEHYGLTRKHLGDGKYEQVYPRHSWNAAQKVSNWFLINLQRHSDHHYKPGRRFPLLQNYDQNEAPQLPYGYPLMTAMAMNPLWFRRTMNPKVRKWRAMYYPEITDWAPYTKASNPLPR